MLKKTKNKIQSKEDFCPVCLLGIPLIFSSISTTASVVSNTNDENIDQSSITIEELNEINRQKFIRKQVIIWSIVIFVLSLLGIWYFKYKKPCDECR